MFLYNLILNFLSPLIMLLLLILSIFNKRLRRTFFQRFFFKTRSRENPPIWFHASSLGEFNAIKNVINLVKNSYDSVIITTLTDTGYEAAIKTFGKDNVYILPLDFNFLIKLFIRKINPILLVIEETELWPNLIFYSAKNNIPIIYTNTIINEKSFNAYKRFSFIFKNILNKINIFFVQNNETEIYLRYFQIPSEKIKYAGNIKFDINIKKTYPGKIKKNLYFSNNNIIITAGSTRDGEEEFLLEAYKKLKDLNKKVKLIIAPRHLERVNTILQLIKKYDFKYSLYSKKIKNFDILVVDKLGVLIDMYSISDISFVGGTIAPIGGHNPLEPAAVGKVVIFGPYINNNRIAFETLLSYKGGFMVKSRDEFVDIVKLLISDSNLLKKYGKNARLVIEQNKGASQKIASYILENFIKK